MSARYSSLRCLAQNASVSDVMAETFAAMARGIRSEEDMVPVRAGKVGFSPIGEVTPSGSGVSQP